jgi:hypothetical protein
VLEAVDLLEPICGEVADVIGRDLGVGSVNAQS